MKLRLFLLLGLSLSGSLALQAADTTPPLPIIIDHVIARDDATQKMLKTMQYHQILKTERLDDSGQVTQTQEVAMLIRPGATDEIQVLSEKGDNLPSNPDEARQQTQGQASKKHKLDLVLKDLVDRFTVTFVDTEAIQNQPVYLLAFEPKPNQPYRNQTEMVLNHLRGKIWVRTRDYAVIKSEATLAEPVEVAWIFAQISALNFHFEQDSAVVDLGPSHIETTVTLTTPILTLRQRMSVAVTQYEPRSKP